MDRLLALLIKLFIFLSGFAKPLSRIGIGTYEEWAPGKKLKLLMVGYNGARNTGADARVVAAVRQIKELFGAENVHISVLTLSVESLNGYFDEDVELLDLNSIFLKDLYRVCSSHHAAVICEGSTLKSTFANALSLFFCEASGIMAKQGKPCIAFGSEVGYMEESLRRFAAKACKGTYFITRTQESQKVLTELGLEGHKGTDTAWLYEGAAEHETTCELLREHGWDGSTPLLGIAVINPFLWPVRASLGKWIKGGITGTQESQYDKWYYYSDSPQRRSDYERYIDEIAKAANSLCERGEFFPVLLGMERMDIEACKSLMQKLEMPAAIFPSGDYTADIMTGILRELSSLITSRYHAAVLSMQKGCPIVAVSMDERLDSLMKEVELEDTYLFHVRDEDLGTELMNAVQKGCNRSQQLREHLEHEVCAYREEQKRMGAFLKRYITDRLTNTLEGTKH